MKSNEYSTISIKDLTGKNLISVNTTKLENIVSVEDLEKGIYFVEVNTKKGTYRTKFIKN